MADNLMKGELTSNGYQLNANLNNETTPIYW